MRRRIPSFGPRIGADARSVFSESPAEENLRILTTRPADDMQWRRALTRAEVDTLQLALKSSELDHHRTRLIQGRIDSIRLQHLAAARLDDETITPDLP
jgi:hypothetical protein